MIQSSLVQYLKEYWTTSLSGRPIGLPGLSGPVAIDSAARTIWVADAYRGDGRRFVVRVDEKLTAFLELEAAIPPPCPRTRSFPPRYHWCA